MSTVRNVSDQLIVGCVNVQSIARKSALVCRTIDEVNADLMVLTETWHECSGAVSLQTAIPEGYKCIDAARPLPPGTDVNSLSLRSYGGIAVIYRSEIEFRKRAVDLLTTTFENLCCVANISGKHFSCCVYIDQVVRQSARCFSIRLLQFWSSCYC